VGVDYWWFGFFVDERMYNLVQPHFAAAAAKTTLSPESRHAIAAWRVNPSDFEQEGFISRPETADQTNAFIRAFNLAGFVELTTDIVTGNGPVTEILNERSRFRMAITPRHTSVSIVWHALGYRRASLLPGLMGNVLLRPDEVEQALETARSAYAGTSPQDLLDAARRYCSGSVGDDALRETLNFLPDGLDAAMRWKSGFLTLACPRI
jgi:hypothetical protein